MDFSVINAQMVANLFLLLLIGLGPKIALVPFLEKTKHLDAQRQREVGTKMVKTALVTAVVLFATGALLMRLLHVSSGGVSIAGGIVLLLLALKMVSGHDEKASEEAADLPIDHHQMAIYPLAIPYLLNPVGIAVLLIASSKVDSILSVLIVVGLIVVVGAIDFLVFRNMDKLSKRLNPSTLVISEVVFGILLTALAVELVVSGLAAFDIIEHAGHH